jgi:acylpyruvate hydrolase
LQIPLSRPFIPKERLADVGKVGLWLKINDELKQKGVASDMVFDVPKLINHVSSIFTLTVSTQKCILVAMTY